MSPIEHDVLHQIAQEQSQAIEPTHDISHPLGQVVQHLAYLIDHSLDGKSDGTRESLAEILLKDKEVKLALREQFGTAFEASPIIALGDLFKMTALLSRNFVSSLTQSLMELNLLGKRCSVTNFRK